MFLTNNGLLNGIILNQKLKIGCSLRQKIDFVQFGYFLMARHHVKSQNEIIFFEYIDFWPKIQLSLYPSLESRQPILFSISVYNIKYLSINKSTVSNLCLQLQYRQMEGLNIPTLFLLVPPALKKRGSGQENLKIHKHVRK